MEFFLKKVNISANQMISGDNKGVNNRQCGLAPLQVWERAVMNIAFYGFPIGMHGQNFHWP